MKKDRMNLIYLIFSFLLLFTVVNLFAGITGKISGFVKDGRNGEPLPGVNVLIEGTNLGAATDLDGYFMILNIPPGSYTIQGMMVGYATTTMTGVRIMIDQTTGLDIELTEEALETETIEIVATRPVVERDVAASRANIAIEEIESIPIVSVDQAVGLQAGMQGLAVRGSNLDETSFVLDGITLRDERNNTPFSGVSYAAVEEIQVQSGGFSAEFGNVRGGVVNVISKGGSRTNYNFNLIGRYAGASPKHFGPSPNAADSYWIKPYVDNAVAWTGTKNGAWDYQTRLQYPEFAGWHSVSQTLLDDDDPTNDLSPEAAQRLYLWQHRRQLDVQDPDYVMDFSFGGPVPVVSQDLGGLRFQMSYRTSQSMYMIPLTADGYRDYTFQFKLTSDIAQGMRIVVDYVNGRQTGTAYSRSGGPGLFNETWRIAGELSNGPKYIDARMFNTDYWTPSEININSIGVKFNHVLSANTFYDAVFSRFESKYDTNPGRPRDRTPVYLFGNSYYVDESPFGWEELSTSAIDGMRMGAGMSNARDSSVVATYTLKLDLTSQLDRFNKLRAGFELAITDSRLNYANYDKFLFSGNTQTEWERTPVRGGLYIEDKLEFEGMIAQLGVRLDYFTAGGDWYANYDPYDPAFSPVYAGGIDTLLNKEPTKKIIELSPRLAISYPISVNSKLFFNYGHFRQLPTPENLFLLRNLQMNGQVTRIGAPNNPLPRTIAYELGFEQSLWEQVLLRAAGYYKDISDQPRLVNYQNYDGSVDYTISEPDSYEDIRGFEITLNKNRGEWFRGFVNYTYMVTTSGNFGYAVSYLNPVSQRDYERFSTDHYQTKPVPRPYARMNLDFFTPMDYGPELGGIYPLEEISFNILGSWSSGTWEIWNGGGYIPGLQYNVQWRDYYNFNIRLGKSFHFKGVNLELFIDINNVLNNKYMSSGGYGFVDSQDRRAYFESLHLPGDTDGINQFGYINIPGDDQPGDYRPTGVNFVPIIATNSYSGISEENWEPRYLYYFTQGVEGVHGAGYYRWVNNDMGSPEFVKADQGDIDQILEDKSYIDMPNLSHFTFLDPRNFFWGLKLSFDL